MKPLHNLRQKFENVTLWIPCIGAIYLFTFYWRSERPKKQRVLWYLYQIMAHIFGIVSLICLIFILKLKR